MIKLYKMTVDSSPTEVVLWKESIIEVVSFENSDQGTTPVLGFELCELKDTSHITKLQEGEKTTLGELKEVLYLQEALGISPDTIITKVGAVDKEAFKDSLIVTTS